MLIEIICFKLNNLNRDYYSKIFTNVALHN